MFMEGMYIFPFSSAEEELAASAPLSSVLGESLDIHLPSPSQSAKSPQDCENGEGQ